MDLKEIRTKLEGLKGRREQVIEDLGESKKKKIGLEGQIVISEKASAIISNIAKVTQGQLEYQIADPASLALAAVFDNPYKMSAIFSTTERGTTECKLGFERNQNIIKPVDASGGGTVDVGAFGLRVGSLSLLRPKTRPVLILDEPFRFVSRGNLPRAGNLLKQLSKDLNLQIIMITHIQELIDCADNGFRVKIRNGITEVVS